MCPWQALPHEAFTFRVLSRSTTVTRAPYPQESRAEHNASSVMVMVAVKQPPDSDVTVQRCRCRWRPPCSHPLIDQRRGLTKPYCACACMPMSKRNHFPTTQGTQSRSNQSPMIARDRVGRGLDGAIDQRGVRLTLVHLARGEIPHKLPGQQRLRDTTGSWTHGKTREPPLSFLESWMVATTCANGRL